MRLEDAMADVAGKGQIKIEVRFAAINPIDWKVRRGDLKMMTGKTFPRGMGSDFSGHVISVGDGVTGFKPGDAVFGLARLKESGALGEVVVTNESFITKKPDSVSLELAACLGTPSVTAWNGLVDKARLKAGQRVFVNGCAGAVGAAAVQIARMLGATVAGSCGMDSIPYAKSLGVSPIFDYRTTDLSKLSERYDVVYDTSGTMPTAFGLGLLSKGGVFLDILPTPGKFIRSMFNWKLKPIICSPTAKILKEISKAAAAGDLRLRVGKTVPLAKAIELITELENGRKINGKGLVAI